MAISESQKKAVGEAILTVLPDDPRPWHRVPHLRYLNFCLLSLVLVSSTNGYDGSLMNGLQALPEWQKLMDKPTGAWLGFVNASQRLGALVGYLWVAYSSDIFGRKATFLQGYFWLLLGTAIQTTGQSKAMFIVGRTLLGGATACFGSCSPVLIAELAYPTHRGVLTAMYQCGWYIDSLLAAWTCFGARSYTDSWGWRIPSIVQLAVPAAQLRGTLLVPESPRWLVSKGRTEEAYEIVARMHAGGDKTSPLVEFEMEEMTRSIQLERELKASTSWKDMVSTQGNCKCLFISITLGVFAQWNGVGLVSYYLSPILKSVGVTNVTHITLLNGCLQIWNLFFAVCAALMVDKVGRRTLFLTSSIGMLCSYIFVTGLSGSFAETKHGGVGIAVIPFLYTFYAFYDIAFTPLLGSYPTEIWQYTLRARGVALVHLATQVAVFFNIFVNPIALAAIAWKYYILFVVLLIVITATIYFFYPETRGYTLEEIARVFDGENAAVPSEGAVMDGVKKSQGEFEAESVSHVEKA